MSDAPFDEIHQFLSDTEWEGAEIAPLAGDASFRRYFRLRKNAQSAMLMHAPPPHEDPAPFLHVAGWLDANGMRAPAVIAEDAPKGWVLTEDFGDHRMREWIDQRNVDMVGGLVASSVSIAVTKVLQENNGLGIVSGSAASSITNEHCTPNHIHWVYDTYPLANGTAKAVVELGGDSWFLLTADYAFGHALEADVTSVVEANGGEIVGGVRHPFPTSDFSSYILQAQGSGAKIVGLANAGADTVNAITTASQFGLTQSGQQLAGLLIFLNDVHALGLEATQGLLLTTGWYWDMNEDSREFAQRYFDRVGSMPNMSQAANYSSTMHYLRAIEEAGTDDPDAVSEAMRSMPINDFFATDGYVREDGRMMHDMYLWQVKSPDESEGEWDYLTAVSTIPAEDAFRPLDQSTCYLVTGEEG